MTKKFYRISIFTTLAFLLFSTVLSPLAAFASTTQNEVKDSVNELYKVAVKDAPVTSIIEDQEVIVGTLSENTEIQAIETIEGFIHFQWGTTTASIKEEHVEQVVDSMETDSTFYGEVTTVVTLNSDTFVYNAQNEVVAVVKSHQQYPVYEQTKDNLIILLGGKKLFLSRTEDLVLHSLAANSTVKEETSTNTKDATKDENSLPASTTVEEKTGSTILTNTEQTTQPFTSAVKFFKVTADDLTVYDNSTGKLLYSGSLEKGAVFERVGDLGNWHKIKFGSGFGYVWKDSTIPADGSGLKLNKLSALDRTFTAKQSLEVVDNSTGSLIRFARIGKGQTYPILRTIGNWIEIDLAGRVGYVYKSGVSINFKSTDRYFKVLTEQLSIYDNSSGKLVKVGVLEKGQEYARVNDFGNWHSIKFGSVNGFVWKDSTEPSTGASIRNLNYTKNTSDVFIPIREIAVYDNTSGSLVPFGTIQKGVTYPIISDIGNWYKIDLSGRAGYVYKPATKLPFKSTDLFFEVLQNGLPIYDNSSGSLVAVGTLVQGQVYPRTSQSGNWHQIAFKDGFAYVLMDETRPVLGTSIKNINNGLLNSDRTFTTLTSAPVYDNTGNGLVAFSYLKPNQRYPIISESGDWLQISVVGRIGYVHKSAVQFGPIYRNSQYSTTLEEMLTIQMAKGPQTDKYRYDKTYVHKDFVTLETAVGTFPAKGVVTASKLNVREGPDTSFWAVGSLSSGNRVDILSQTGDWYEIKYGVWRNAKETDVLYYLNPSNFNPPERSYFQFLLLSESAGISERTINEKILFNKGILQNHGYAFVSASLKYSVNEIYLIAHALLESGNGSSSLANGMLVSEVDGQAVTPRIVYNMYGVGAYDSCPLKCGTEFAYKQGWFTPEAAIIGGAEYISQGYINHAMYQQNTLYKMRWNPQMPGIHQYATDIGWADKQVSTISNLYNLLHHNDYTLIFDLPVYR